MRWIALVLWSLVAAANAEPQATLSLASPGIAHQGDVVNVQVAITVDTELWYPLFSAILVWDPLQLELADIGTWGQFMYRPEGVVWSFQAFHHGGESQGWNDTFIDGNAVLFCFGGPPLMPQVPTHATTLRFRVLGESDSEIRIVRTLNDAGYPSTRLLTAGHRPIQPTLVGTTIEVEPRDEDIEYLKMVLRHLAHAFAQVATAAELGPEYIASVLGPIDAVLDN